ncbi:MAG: hypothetical protein ACLGXA_14590 [Acidobacteriota bacterium]
MLSDSDIRERLGPLTEPEPSPDQNPRHRAGNLAVRLAILAAVLWGLGIAVLALVERRAPRVPQPATGHVYWFSDSLHTMYLTALQRDLAWAAIAIPALVTLGIGGYFLFRPRAPEHY